MYDVTHLSDNFNEEFHGIAARLRAELTWKQYGELRNYFHDKKLVGATRYIKHVAKQRDTVSLEYLALRRKSVAWNKLYREIVDMIETHARFTDIVDDWNDLMRRNGGAKRAGQLARKELKELSSPSLPQFTVIR